MTPGLIPGPTIEDFGEIICGAIHGMADLIHMPLDIGMGTILELTMEPSDMPTVMLFLVDK